MNLSKKAAQKSVRSKRITVSLTLFLFLAVIASSALMADKKEQKGYLGISVSKLTRLDRRQLDAEFGVLVTEVEKNSAADKAGILEDDVIQYLKGEKITETMDLVEVVRSTAPGEKIKVKIIRNGRNKTITVTMGEYKSDIYSKLIPKSRLKKEDFFKWVPKGEKKLERFFGPPSRGYMGVSLHAMDDCLSAYFGVKKTGGLLILSVEGNSPAEKGGLKAGDVILAVNNKPMVKTEEVTKEIFAHKPGEEISVKILRHKKEMVVKVKLGKARGVFGYGIMEGKPGELKQFGLHLPQFDLDMPRFDVYVPHGGLLHGYFDKDKDIYLWNFDSRLKDKLKNVRIKIDQNFREKLKNLKIKLKDRLKKAKKIRIHPFYI